MFSIKYSKQSRKFLRKASKILAKRLIQKVEILGKKPVIHDSKPIEGSSNLFRVRVGDYRILYEVDYKSNTLGIIRIDKRTRVYQ